MKPNEMMNGYALGLREGAIEEARKSEESLGPLMELLLALNEGRVVVLPCKVGDVAYHLTSIDTLEELNVAEIFEGKVCSISKDEKNLWIFCRYDNGLNFWYTEKDIGRKLFLVREEAEQALKGAQHEE